MNPMDERKKIRRLHNRCRLPEHLNLEDRIELPVRDPILFFQEHPEYQIEELVFDPASANDELIEQLKIRVLRVKV